MRTWKTWKTWCVSAMLGLWAANSAMAQTAFVVEPFAPFFVAAVKEEAETEFWLGLQLGPVHPQLKGFLGREHGLMVERVYPESPAANAGVKVHDLLIKVADQDVKEPSDVMEPIAASQGKEVSLIVLRAGKEVKLKVTPQPRPKQLGKAEVELGAQAEEPLEKTLEWLQKMPGFDRDAVKLFAVKPGMIAGKVSTSTDKLPAGLSISIEKSGDAPAKIRVKKSEANADGTSERSWEVTEDKLDELPADVRAHVQKMLGGRLEFSNFDFKTQIEKMQNQAEEAAAAASAKAKAAMKAHMNAKTESHRGVEEKLDTILKKLDQQQSETEKIEALQKELKQLRKELEDLRGQKSRK